MIDGDRDALRERLIALQLPARMTRWSRAAAILDADDLLVVDLRCPTCEGTGQVTVYEGVGPLLDPCPTCHGSGRRQVKVVDADLLRVVAKAALIRWQELVTDNGVTYRVIDTFVPEKRAQVEEWSRG